MVEKKVNDMDGINMADIALHENAVYRICYFV